jgi:hypothetical protein
MATVARRLLLRAAVGERLLSNKLQILSGNGPRRTSLALSILTGRAVEAPSAEDPHLAPGGTRLQSQRRRFTARTVYLSERHLHDIDRIIQAWQQAEPKRLTRSAVLRRAVEHLRNAVEANPDHSVSENE